MAQEPTFPTDAAVGKDAKGGAAKGHSGGSETLDVAASANQTKRALAEKAEKDEKGSWTPYIVAGAAVGIGSAALAAALLYGRSRKSDKKS